MKLQLKIEKRWWFGAAFEVLMISCALVSFISIRAAGWLAEGATTVLVRKGLHFSTVSVD